MHVYHMIDPFYGIKDLKEKHMKVSILDQLNDPFELFGIDLSDEELRSKFRKLKDELSAERGLLCFSRGWQNPVMWSHYADKHQGLCLGFDIPDKFLKKVNYADSRKRLLIEIERSLICNDNPIDIQKFIYTKYSHWRYENEVRWLIDLKDVKIDGRNYFVEFSNDLKLTQVIIGAKSKLGCKDIYDALGDDKSDINIFEARLAFKTFKVVRQRNPKLWN